MSLARFWCAASFSLVLFIPAQIKQWYGAILDRPVRLESRFILK